MWNAYYTCACAIWGCFYNLFITVKSEHSHALHLCIKISIVSFFLWWAGRFLKALQPLLLLPQLPPLDFPGFPPIKCLGFPSLDFLCWNLSDFRHRHFSAIIWALNRNSSLDNSAGWLGFAILVTARAASRLNPASDQLPRVEELPEDQLVEDAEQESRGAGGVHHDLHGDRGRLLQLYHLLSVFRIDTQHSKTYHAEDKDDQMEKVDEEQLVSGHLDLCSDKARGVFLFVVHLGLRTRCCYWEAGWHKLWLAG